LGLEEGEQKRERTEIGEERMRRRQESREGVER